MKKFTFFITLMIFFPVISNIYAQDVEGAIERLKEKGLITRIIDSYRLDQGRPAYLKELILAVDEAVRYKATTSDLVSRINKLESDVVQLKNTKSPSRPAISNEEIRTIVRQELPEISQNFNLKISQITDKIKADSMQIVNFENKLKTIDNPKPVNQNSVFMTILMLSAVIFLSAH